MTLFMEELLEQRRANAWPDLCTGVFVNPTNVLGWVVVHDSKYNTTTFTSQPSMQDIRRICAEHGLDSDKMIEDIHNSRDVNGITFDVQTIRDSQKKD